MSATAHTLPLFADESPAIATPPRPRTHAPSLVVVREVESLTLPALAPPGESLWLPVVDPNAPVLPQPKPRRSARLVPDHEQMWLLPDVPQPKRRVHLRLVVPTRDFGCLKTARGCKQTHCRYHLPPRLRLPVPCAIAVANAYRDGMSPQVVSLLMGESEGAIQSCERAALAHVRYGGDEWDALYEMVRGQ